MRRVILVTIVLVVLGCASDPPQAPTSFPVLVDVVPVSEVFTPKGDIAAILTNRSLGTVYLDLQCLPTLERGEGDAWVEAVLPLRVGCTDEERPPIPIAAGASVNLELPRAFFSSALEVGRYRFRATVGGSDRNYETRVSAPFEIAG